MFKNTYVREIERRSFGKIKNVATIPSLIEVQKNSYEEFLQFHVDPDKRSNIGLQSVFKSIFPVTDYAGECTLEFVNYRFDKPKYDVEESRHRSISYVASLKVTLRLVIWDIDPDTGAKEVNGIKEQEVFMGDIPLMTDNATFIINGVERVIVSQMHRSPGVFFDHDHGKVHTSGKFLYSARVIPYRGSWLDFEFDGKDLIYFRIDRRRKLYVSTLLRAIGMSTNDMYQFFYSNVKYKKVKNGWSTEFKFEENKSIKLSKDLVNADTGKVVVKEGSRINKRVAKKLSEEGLKNVFATKEDLVGKFIATDIADKDTGEVIVQVGDELTLEKINLIESLNIKQLEVLNIDHNNIGPYIRHTIKADKNETEEEALFDIFKVIRPGEPTTYETSKTMFDALFFDPIRYDLSVVGRVKINSRLNLNIDEKPLLPDSPMRSMLYSKEMVTKNVAMGRSSSWTFTCAIRSNGATKLPCFLIVRGNYLNALNLIHFE